MRRVSLAILVLAALAVSYALGRHHADAARGSKGGRHVLYYVDPMHPAYRSEKPGIAPDCGMALEPVFAEDAGRTQTSASAALLPLGTVSVDGSTQRMLGIRVAAVERAGASRIIRAVGRVAPEDTRVYKINAGTEGFVRETFSDSVGLMVKKDQKLAACYSPEFLSVASGYLASAERVPGYPNKDGNRTVPFPGAVSKQGVSSLQGYTDRLRNLGMSDVQIQSIGESHQLPQSVDVVAPADGFILARNISAGEHFDRAMEFYRIADLSRVWVIAEVYQDDAPYLRPGVSARVGWSDAGRQLPARITDSLPQSEAGGGSVKIRLEVDNPGFALRPDMLVDVELPVRMPSAVTVPLDALVASGTSARVYVEQGEGVFEPRQVETGWRDGERVEILRGVQPGERVVAAATFLVDSESRLKTPASAPASASGVAAPATAPEPAATAKMVTDPSCGMSVDPAQAAAASGHTVVDGGKTYYFCSQRCKETFKKYSAGSAGSAQGRGR